MASILECSTNAMGTVKVEWKEEDLYGDHDIEWLDVVEVRPIEEKLLDRFDVYVSGGYSCTKASDVAQTTFNTEIGYEDERTRNAVTGRQTYTNTESDSSSSSRWDLSRRDGLTARSCSAYLSPAMSPMMNWDCTSASTPPSTPA